VTLLLGEAGTGKTTILQAALSELDHDRIECVLVSNPTLTRTEFYEFLSEGFGLGSAPGGSKSRFLLDLRRLLLERQAEGRMSAVVFDESQSMSYELLEEIRLLSNVETTTVKLLNVVLAGQPELSDRLNEPGLRQLKQRIALRCKLGPFAFQETAAYIAGRLRIAGGDPAAIFSREAILAIHEASRGLPRTVNVICDNALIGGFAAQVKPIVRSFIVEVCRDFDLRTLTDSSPMALEAEEQVAAVSETNASAPSLHEERGHDAGQRKRFVFF
jgi:type II secretory pathway predicted ATPase ExeA